MKKIQLTNGYEAIVDDEDFDRINQFSWCGAKDDGRVYAVRSQRINGRVKTFMMHRDVLNAEPGTITDHKDGDGLNNQKINLRLVSTRQNIKNQKLRCNNSSGFKGVTWVEREGKWKAKICVNYAPMFLGYFDDKKEAAIAYDKAALNMHGEFACTNLSLGLLAQ